MTEWKREIPLKPILEDYEAHGNVALVRELTVELLRDDTDPGVQEIADLFAETEHEDDPVDAFDRVLSELYDYADDANLWIGHAAEVIR